MILQLWTQPDKQGERIIFNLGTVRHPLSGSNDDTPTNQYYQGTENPNVSFGTGIGDFLHDKYGGVNVNVTYYTKSNDSINFDYYESNNRYTVVTFNRVGVSVGVTKDDGIDYSFATVLNSPVLQAYNFVITRKVYIAGDFFFNFENFGRELVRISDIQDSPISASESIGDGGSYDFTGDNIDLPTAPDESVTGVLASGFLNIYSPTANQLRNFGGALWTNAFNTKWYDLDSVANLVLNAVSDPINFIVGLFMLPVTPTTGSASGIYLGGINVNTVSANRITKQYVTLNFGSIDITEMYGSYLDYAYSRLTIYLPYIGMADIDVQEVTGGSVELQYIIDCFTGACVANVKCTKNTTTAWGETYVNSTVHSYSGNVALQLPISAGSFDIMTQGLINVGLGLISGQPQSVAKGATDIIQNVGGDATTRGSLSSNTGKLCYQTPYLMFTRPIETRPASLGALHGYSAGFGGKLSSFSGYVVCSDVKMDGITATDAELNEIETMLKTGVYV